MTTAGTIFLATYYIFGLASEQIFWKMDISAAIFLRHLAECFHVLPIHVFLQVMLCHVTFTRTIF